MSQPLGFPQQAIDHDDIDNNNSGNETFEAVLQARMSRRSMLRGGVGTAATAVFGGLAVAACGGGGGDDDDNQPGNGQPPAETLLGFKAVAKSLADTVVVPEGYTASVLYRLGDPIAAGVAAYKNDGTDDNYEQRAGDHHDGMEFFGLNAAGTARDPNGSERGLLAMNHEATSDENGQVLFMHPAGGSPNSARVAAEVDKEVAAHGISIVEVRKADGRFRYVQDSAYNRRFTPLTPVVLAGPARGHALMVTKYSTDGTAARGTLNNCGTGYTPWGTLLSGEENWANYFKRSAEDDTARAGDKSIVALERYGRKKGANTRHGWETAGSEDKYARWDLSVKAATADGDYRNELNTYGYIVEADPYDRNTSMKKRTALGRFAHESAAFSRLVPGKPLAVYMGDDSRGEYMYKFVSTAVWNAADANPANRITTGDKYLDSGKLFVAKFNADGTGQWIELSINQPAIAGYAAYDFADQADVLINARLAADAVGATKMDRPEWCATHPGTGEVYYTLTNNSNRKVEPDPASTSQMGVDAANPRSYKDGGAGSAGNHNGHIIRLRENGGEAAATGFAWDVYLFGAEVGSDPATVNLSGLTADQDFSSPDGLWFSRATGVCWIQTDDGAYTDVTNCMMLAALPGQVGDGGKKTLTHTKADKTTLAVDTQVGKAPTAQTLKRFLVGPVGSEITGCAETPDGKALFVNIQHPGESTRLADISTPSKYSSHWPDGGTARPRSATIVITKNDGGRIGS